MVSFGLMLVYLVLGVCLGVGGQFTPVLEIGQGKLSGLRSLSGQNRYYGIPYATSQRFQAPQKPPRWKGTLTAVRRLGHCAQTVAFLALGTEDCLQLDVYAPERARRGDRLPVFVFLHGGSYYYGTKAHYDPEFLVTKGVVAVIVNYRVGVLGFLCVNGVANLGLKDQVAALKWIQKNIAAFGGDPDNVTLSGQSAGASAAAMHMLSDSSKGLFHKLILMSGNPLTPWAFNVEPLRPALEDAKKMNPVSTEQEVYDIFANASLADILMTCRDVTTNPRYFKYSPCVDANYTDAFFRDTPYNIIKSGSFNKVPMIVGATDAEGLLFYGLNNDESFKDLDENFIERLPSVFSWLSSEEKIKVGKKIRNHYFGSERIDKRAIRGVVEYYSDWLAYASLDAFVKLMSEESGQPVYSYLFGYEGERNFAKLLFGGGTGLAGASHSDDIFYVFKPAGLSLLLSARDRIIIDRLTTLFTNFMKYRDPTPTKSALVGVHWPAQTQGGNASALVVMRDGALAVAPPRARPDFLHAMLCAHGQPGHVPCRATHPPQ